AKDLAENVFGPIIPDEHLLVESTAHFLGEPVLVIAGENKKAIEKAKKAIKIEMEELPPVFTIEEAMEKSQYIGVPRFIKNGNFQSAYDQAEHKLEGIFN